MGPREVARLIDNILIKDEKRDKTLHNEKLKQLISRGTNSFKVKLMCYKRKFNSPWCYKTSTLCVSLLLLLLFSLPPSLSLSLSLSLFFQSPILFLPSPLYRYFSVLISTAVLSPVEFSGLFSSPLSVSSLPLS